MCFYTHTKKFFCYLGPLKYDVTSEESPVTCRPTAKCFFFSFLYQGLCVSVHETSMWAGGRWSRDVCRRSPTRRTVSSACSYQDRSHVPCQEKGTGYSTKAIFNTQNFNTQNAKSLCWRTVSWESRSNCSGRGKRRQKYSWVPSCFILAWHRRSNSQICQSTWNISSWMTPLVPRQVSNIGGFVCHVYTWVK